MVGQHVNCVLLFFSHVLCSQSLLLITEVKTGCYSHYCSALITAMAVGIMLVDCRSVLQPVLITAICHESLEEIFSYMSVQ